MPLSSITMQYIDINKLQVSIHDFGVVSGKTSPLILGIHRPIPSQPCMANTEFISQASGFIKKQITDVLSLDVH